MIPATRKRATQVRRVIPKRQVSLIQIQLTPEVTFQGAVEPPEQIIPGVEHQGLTLQDRQGGVEQLGQMKLRRVTQRQVIHDPIQGVQPLESFWPRDAFKDAFWKIVKGVQRAIVHVLVCRLEKELVLFQNNAIICMCSYFCGIRYLV